MPLRLNARDRDFAAGFARLISAKRTADADVGAVVGAILADVRARGDAAVIEYTLRFDRLTLTPATMAFGADEIARATAKVDSKTMAALEMAAQRIRDFHLRQMPIDGRYVDAQGVELGWRWGPIAAVGLYVPGGKAAYPSSVLMNALPAALAGVGRVVMCVPAPDGGIDPLVLAAARLAGVSEIYRIGGAQAVGALAYGTATIAAVDKIVGPGNVYVAAAKRQVHGTVGVDGIAGPSEILVVADGNNDPAWIAADLLAQAEHDEAAQAMLITDDAAFADRVAAAAESQLRRMTRANIARASWDKFGAIIVVERLADAPPLVDRVAPEHLQLATDRAEELAAQVRHAGAIFLGRFTPEAIGDYVAGPNHVLPTAGAARFSSGLSVLDFMKRTSIIRCDADSLRRIGPAAVSLAEAEGLGAHALSVALRLDGRKAE